MRVTILIILLLMLNSSSVLAKNKASMPIFHAHHVHQKIIAFTFDDGPDPVNTVELLKVLKQEKAKATFFVLGKKARKYPVILKMIVKEGHEIGNHGFSHRQFRKLTAQEVSWELRNTERIILNATGKRVTCFRSPYGQITPTIRQEAYRRGYRFIEWSIDPRDWDHKNANSIHQSVEPYVLAGDIVLFHDGGKNGKETIKAVRSLIKHLKAKGYTFVTVSDLMKHF